MNPRTLKDRLADWTDADLAAYELAVVVGIAPEFDSPHGDPPHDGFHGMKGILWSNNTVGNKLYEALGSLVMGGMLICDEDTNRFKWNPNFTVEGP